ncbi:MAG: YdbH domain-containing protein [Alphaproteobacteria bacterium]
MTSERKKRRWWKWTLGAGLGVLVLIVGGGLVVLDRYASDIVVQALIDADLPQPRLRVESVGLSESRLLEIKLGADDALVAESLSLEYDLFDLLDLDLSDLTVRLVRPTLKMTVADDGTISFGSLDALLAGPSTGADDPLPFHRVVLDEAILQIDTPQGPIVARVDGSIENSRDEGLSANLTILAADDLLAFDGDIFLTVGSAGAIAGEATVRNASGVTPWGTAHGGQGSIALRWDGAGLPHGDVDLAFRRLEVPNDLLPEQLPPDGIQLDDVEIRASFDGGAMSAAVSAADNESGNAVDLEIRIPDVVAGGEATIAADLSTSGSQVLWLWQDAWTGDGSLIVAVEIATMLPPLAELLLADPAAPFTLPDGQIDVRWILSDATFPGFAQQVSAIGEVEIAVTQGVATLTAGAPVEIRIGALDPELHASAAEADPAWAPILARDLAGRLDVALEGRGSRPLSITLARRDDGWSIRGDATALVATTGGPLVAAELSGNATVAETLRIVIDDLSLFASDIETPAGSIGVLEAAGRIAYRDGVPDFDMAGAVSELSLYDPALSFPRLAIELAMAPSALAPDSGVLEGPITVSFADSDGAIDEVAMTGLSGELTGRLIWDHGVGRLIFTEDAAFRVESMDIDGSVLIPEPALVRVTASEHPVLELDFNDPAGWSLRHSINVGPLDLRGSIRLGDERVQTAIRTRDLTMEGGYIEGRYVMQIEVAGVSGSAPREGWSIEGANVVIDYDDNDPQNLLVLQATAGDLRTSETHGALSRIGMRGRMDYGLDDIIRVTARVFDERNILIADVNLRHTIDTNAGSADLAVQDLIFSPLVLQPGDISPLLTGFENVTGTVDVRGSVRWTGSTITPDLALHISDVSGEYDDVQFTHINTVVELSNLSPLETDSGQLLSIATVDMGVPISDARVLFALRGGDTLAVEQATFAFAGGVVSARHQAVSFTAEEQVIDLVVTGVDLGTLLGLADLETLEAKGTLDGVIPIVVVNGDLVIPEAWLSAREPGYIRYDAAADLGAIEGTNQGVDLMIELLENFLFDELDLRLMRPVAGDLQIGFRILGRNPDVYGGVPIDLSLNVDGQLEDVIQNSLDIYRVPETIQDLIMEYGFDAATPSN